MIYTLGLKDLPFEPDARQIIYIDGGNDDEVKKLIEYNYFGIRRCFESLGYEFCYIPFLKRELDEYEKIHYNAPYAKSGHLKFITDDNFILNYMLEPEKRNEVPASLLYYIPDLKDECCPKAQYFFRGIPIKESSFEKDSVLRNVLKEIQSDIEENSDQNLYRSDDDWFPMASENGVITADDDFDFESKLLMKEIEERIEKLRQKGISRYIIKQLVMNSNERLSRLHITKRNEILLIDYFAEIKMTPLPKAVFLLFLKHPEGIMFSYLPDYREELLEIYKKVKGPFYNETDARRSIWDVTDPLKNSINEKCSRIREAFLSQFDDDFARFYYVDGERGEPKKIILPRDLVKWE